MKIFFAKPKIRSAPRLYFGIKYFTLQRHVKLFFSGIKFAEQNSQKLAHKYFAHKTPLYRQLKNVDMWMQENKVTNLKIAVQKINLVTVKPGETFSYWRLIGKPTRRKGYKKGMVLKSGTVTSATGGGLCQLSNLIYWLTIHTPLTVIERHRHGYDVFPDSNRTQPFGSGATCFYNYGDLIIENNTPQKFQLEIKITNEFLEGAWLCDTLPEFKYEVYEKEHIMQSEFWGGYTRRNIIYRKKYDSRNNLLDDEFVVENQAIMMYAPFITEAKRM
jgi:vancomycin resistance protein VanW